MVSGPHGEKNGKKEGGGLATRLSHAGRARNLTLGGVNPVVQRASTVLVERAAGLFEAGAWTYGRHGTATHEALKQALCEAEGSAFCVLAPSGLMACTAPLLAFAEPGGHILVGDNVYGPTRRFVDRVLGRLGVEVTYFEPGIGGGIADLIRSSTRLLFAESPGSLTFEIADAPAMSRAARAAGVISIMDNTWSAGLFYRPLGLGFDMSVQANTKYISGGADILSGAVHTDDETIFTRLRDFMADMGSNVSADDAYAVLRGVRSLPVRMSHHQTAALQVAQWLSEHPAIDKVLHPGLPDMPGHALWRRDFTGASGLFGFVLKSCPPARVHRFLDGLRIFGLGFSYGGFESLAINCDPQLRRTAGGSALAGPLIRLSIGLEDPEDLIGDLAQALDRSTGECS
jgi:cystathionine beta-lyase